jgi:hypothetical protein
MRLFAIFFLLIGAASAASDASGRWNGVIVIARSGSNEIIRTPVEMELAERGGRVEGKIGRKGDPERVVIRNGSADGPNVTFEASSAETAGPMRFALKRSGDRLEGEMRGPTEDGEIAGKVEFTREKE